MNNDVILDKDCIKILMETFETNPKIGVVGAVQFFEGGGRNKPLSFFHRGEDDVGNVYKREVTTEEENSLFVEADIGGGFGCAMLKKEVWEKVGYYDTQFSPAMYEQEDFCLRAKEAGFKVGLAPKAHCVHLVAQTTSFNPSYFQKVIDINREKFRAKWGQKLRENKI
jgi:GT2 family glycosyltransferase